MTRSSGSLPSTGSPSSPILLIDTASAHGSVALVDGGRVIHSISLEDFRLQAERLFPALDELLRANQVPVASLRAIAVSTGPGAFTAIRLGLSAAKGIAETAGIPLLGISAFQAAAHQATLPAQALACVALPARRNEVFLAMVYPDGRHATAPLALPLHSWVPDAGVLPTHLLTTDAAILEAAQPHRHLSSAIPVLLPLDPTPSFAALAGELADARQFQDPLVLDAAYVRHLDADRSWADRHYAAPHLSPPSRA